MLGPRLIFSSGMAAAGKTTTCKEIAKIIPNAFYLDRDDIVPSLLSVHNTISDELPPFREYVKNDSVFPDNVRMINTPFGEMLQLSPANHYHRRHSRDQSYLIMASLAARGLSLGKVIILDCFLMRQINDDTLKRFIEQPLFEGYPKYHIHFAVDKEVCWQRIISQAKEDKESAIRRHDMLSREDFEKKIKKDHQAVPEGLKNYKHFFMDTTSKSVEECAKECLEYISGPSPY